MWPVVRNVFALFGAIATFVLGGAGLYYGTGIASRFELYDVVGDKKSNSKAPKLDPDLLWIGIRNVGPEPLPRAVLIRRLIYRVGPNAKYVTQDEYCFYDDLTEVPYLGVGAGTGFGIPRYQNGFPRTGHELSGTGFCLIRDGKLPWEKVITHGRDYTNLAPRIEGESRTWDYVRDCDEAMQWNYPMRKAPGRCQSSWLFTDGFETTPDGHVFRR